MSHDDFHNNPQPGEKIMFKETKPWFLSKGILGGGTALLVGLANLWGYAITEADVAQVADLVTAIVTSAAGIMAIFGRVVADKRIG